MTVPLPERATGAKFPLAASAAPNTTSGTWLAVTMLGGGKFVPDERTPAAARMGLTGHCDIMIVTAVEIVEEILNQRG